MANSSVVIVMVPVTATPYVAARLSAVLEPEHQPDAGQHQAPVHLRDVDLTHLRLEVWMMVTRGQ